MADKIPSWVTPGADLVLVGGGWHDMIRNRVRVTRVLARDVVTVLVRGEEVTDIERRYRMDGSHLREAGKHADRYGELLPADHPRVVGIAWREKATAAVHNAAEAATTALGRARQFPGPDLAEELEALSKQIAELASLMATAPKES